jgi:hypothetical protein
MSSTNSSESSLSSWQQYFIGGLVGGTEPIVGQAAVTIKQEIQKGNPIPRSPRVLWSGFLVNAGYSALVTAPQFYVTAKSRNYFSENGTKQLSAYHKIYAAFLSSLTSSVIATPAEMVMARFGENMRLYMEAKKARAQAPKPTYLSTARQIYELYGWRGFSRGAAGIFMRDSKVVWVYSTLSSEMKPYVLCYVPNPWCATIVSGIFAGSIGAVISQPWDNWKLRREMGMKTCLLQFFKNGWKGTAPRLFLIAYTVPHYNVVTDLVTDVLTKEFKKMSISK